MISEMLKLSEQLSAEPILVIVDQNSVGFAEILPTILETLKRDYSFLKVVVEDDVQQSLMKINKHERLPLTVMGEAKYVQQAQSMCRTLYGGKIVNTNNSYLGEFHTACMAAVTEDDYIKFRANLMEAPNTIVEQMYSKLQEASNE